MYYITFVQLFQIIQPTFCVRKVQKEFVYKPCHVAKALFTVASVDAIVVVNSIIVQIETQEFLEQLSSRQKNVCSNIQIIL